MNVCALEKIFSHKGVSFCLVVQLIICANQLSKQLCESGLEEFSCSESSCSVLPSWHAPISAKDIHLNLEN